MSSREPLWVSMASKDVVGEKVHWFVAFRAVCNHHPEVPENRSTLGSAEQGSDSVRALLGDQGSRLDDSLIVPLGERLAGRQHGDWVDVLAHDARPKLGRLDKSRT